MMDVIHTGCFTIIAQKNVNLRSENGTDDSVGLTGIPDNVDKSGIPTK